MTTKQFTRAVPEKPQVQKNYLHLISGGKTLTLGRLTGRRLISEAKNIFKSFIDPRFTNYKTAGESTDLVDIKVYDTISDGCFGNIFQSIDGLWSQSCLSQDQIINFFELFPEWIKPEIWILFLCKKNESLLVDEKNPQTNIMVVCALSDSDGLMIDLDELDRGDPWPKGSCFIVVPKRKEILIKTE